MRRSVASYGHCAVVVAGVAVAHSSIVGCASYLPTTHGVVTPPSQVQTTLALSGAGTVSAAGSGALPNLELGARYGVREHLDVGARVFIAGAAVDGHMRFLNGDVVTLALQPTLGYVYPRRSFLSVPLVVSTPLPNDGRLGIAPAVVAETVWQPYGPQTAILWGLSVASFLAVGDGYGVVPSVVVLAPLATSARVGTMAGQGANVHVSLGVQKAW